MTQYFGNVQNDTPQESLHLRRARITVERVNSILKGCLLKHRTLNYNPLKEGKIINAYAVLLNLAPHFNADLSKDEEVENIIVQGTRKRHYL